MTCQQIKTLLSAYVDEALSAAEKSLVDDHTRDCVSCREELRAYQEMWRDLAAWEPIEPTPGFVSRFWTRASLKRPWYVVGWETVRAWTRGWRWVPALASISLCVALVTALVGYRAGRLGTVSSPEEIALAVDSSVELEMVEYMELARNLEIIEDLDFLESWDAGEPSDEHA